MANYVSKYTGAQIDAAVDKTGELDGKVATLTEEIEILKGEAEEEGAEKLMFAVNQTYNSNTGKFVQNNSARVSFAEPVPFYKGDTLVFKTADDEKIIVQYMRKVGTTGVMDDDYAFISTPTGAWYEAECTLIATENIYVFASVAKRTDVALLPVDVNTTAYITRSADGENSTTLPVYWESHLYEKTADIDNAMNAIGGHGDAFVFFTDPHWSDNQRKTPYIVSYIREHTSIEKVFCGGDIATGGERDLRGYRDVWNSIPVFTVRGNHDQNPVATDETDIISDEEYYNLILRPIEGKAELGGLPYFYLDNKAQKIRYIFMDSGCIYTDTLNNTQIGWLKLRMTELSEEWSVLVLQHMVFSGNAKVSEITMGEHGTILINAINEVWDQLNCTFIGILTGHLHSDYSMVEPTHNYPIIATSCDNGGTARNDYDPVNPSEVGTISEQLLDVVCIDTNAKTIQCIRIGPGNNRSFTY